MNGYGTAEDYYNEFIASLDDSLENMGAIPSDVYVTMNVWVDSDGEIIGRTLDVAQSGESVQVFSYLTAASHGQFASNMVISDNSGNNLILTGSGTLDGNVMDGSFTLTGTNVPVLTIGVHDFDMDQRDKGYINGTFVFSQTGDPQMANYSLSVSCASDDDTMDLSLSMLSNDVSLGALNVSFNQEKYSPVLPEGQYAYRIADADALEEYAANLDVDGFMSGLMQNAFLKYVLEASGYVY